MGVLRARPTVSHVRHQLSTDVELVVGKQKQKTSVVKKDLNPVFMEKFSFKAIDAQVGR